MCIKLNPNNKICKNKQVQFPSFNEHFHITIDKDKYQFLNFCQSCGSINELYNILSSSNSFNPQKFNNILRVLLRYNIISISLPLHINNDRSPVTSNVNSLHFKIRFQSTNDILRSGRITGIALDPWNCVGCGSCVRACPTGAIVMIDGKAHLNDKCDLCGACCGSCPYDILQCIYKIVITTG